jgi:hypothetical protein
MWITPQDEALQAQSGAAIIALLISASSSTGVIEQLQPASCLTLGEFFRSSGSIRSVRRSTADTPEREAADREYDAALAAFRSAAKRFR